MSNDFNNFIFVKSLINTPKPLLLKIFNNNVVLFTKYNTEPFKIFKCSEIANFILIIDNKNKIIYIHNNYNIKYYLLKNIKLKTIMDFKKQNYLFFYNLSLITSSYCDEYDYYNSYTENILNYDYNESRGLDYFFINIDKLFYDFYINNKIIDTIYINFYISKIINDDYLYFVNRLIKKFNKHNFMAYFKIGFETKLKCITNNKNNKKLVKYNIFNVSEINALNKSPEHVLLYIHKNNIYISKFYIGSLFDLKFYFIYYIILQSNNIII